MLLIDRYAKHHDLERKISHHLGNFSSHDAEEIKWKKKLKYFCKQNQQFKIYYNYYQNGA